MCPKDAHTADRMANSVDLDQTAFEGVIWSESTRCPDLSKDEYGTVSPSTFGHQLL